MTVRSKHALFAAAAFSAAAQGVLLALRTLAQALVGASPEVDAAIAAAGLLGVGLGSLAVVPARAAAAALLAGAALTSLALAVGVDPILEVVGPWPAAVRLMGVTAGLGALVAPLGALLVALAAEAEAPAPLYAADLAGAAAALALTPWAVPVVGVAPLLLGLLVVAGALALTLPTGAAAPAPPGQRFEGSLFVAITLAGLVGLAEASLPGALAAATARLDIVLPAVLCGALAGGAAGARWRVGIRAPPLLVVGAAGMLLLGTALDGVGRAVLAWLSASERGPQGRLVGLFLIVGALAAPVAGCSGRAAALAMQQHGMRRVLAATSLAAAAAVLLAVPAQAAVGPIPLLRGASLVVLLGAAVLGSSLPRKVRAAALVASALGLVPVSDSFATTDLSRTLALGHVPEHRGPVTFDAWDTTGRTVVHVEDDRTLYRDGKPDASELGDADTQTLLAVLPLLYAPHASRALVVGLGGGTTARLLASAGEGRAVDVVEFSSATIAALAEPLPATARVVEAEARGYLAGRPGPYDAITMEPTNLFVSGMARLWSVEALTSLRRALRPGGVAVLWSHLYLSSDEVIALQERTLRSVFTEVHVWAGRTQDVFFVVGNGALATQVVELERVLGDDLPCVLARLGHATTGDLLRRRAFLPLTEGPVERDAHPRLAAQATEALLVAGRASPVPFLAPVSSSEQVLDAARLPHGLAGARWPRPSSPPTAQEALALLRSPPGRALVGRLDPQEVLAGEGSPPWTSSVVQAARLLLDQQAQAPAAIAQAVSELVTSSCATAEAWDIGLTLVELAPLESAEEAQLLLEAVAPAEGAGARRRRRAQLACLLCRRLEDTACATRWEAELAGPAEDPSVDVCEGSAAAP